MKKLVLLLAVLLLTATHVDAQRRQHRQKIDRTERIQRRVDNLTESMVNAYGLNDKQKVELQELNKKWFEGKNVGRKDGRRSQTDRNKHSARRQNNDCVAYNKGDQTTCVVNCTATPTLYPEIRMQNMADRVSEYKSGLKKIMSSSQFKAYEKRVAEEKANISKKD